MFVFHICYLGLNPKDKPRRIIWWNEISYSKSALWECVFSVSLIIYF